MNRILLYHTGSQEIRKPDIHYGRKNADFGQGFYLTPDEEFARRWAKDRKDYVNYFNRYELELDGLLVYRFSRDREWLDYLFRNRSGFPDDRPNEDVLIGPIANDTLYDTFGIISSGFLSSEASLQLLQLGPCYTQVAIKTEKAVSQLRWLSGETLDPAEVGLCKASLLQEQDAYQQLFAETLERLTENTDE